MLKKLNIVLPLSLICALAHADVTTAASTPAASAASAPAATASPSASATSTTEVKKDEPATLKYNLDAGTDYSVQAQTQPDGTRKEIAEYYLNPGLAYGEYTSSVFLYYSQDLKDTTKTGSFADPIFYFSHKAIPVGDYFKVSPGMYAVLPMTDGTKNNVELLYSLAGTLGISLNTKNLGIDNWSIGYTVGYQRNFTKYATTAAGEPINIQRIRQRFNVKYKFTDKLWVKTRFQFDTNYSDEGIIRNSFLHFETLGWDITDVVTLSVGHTNTNTLLNGTTYESNLKFYDEASSSYAVGLDISI